MLSNPLADLSMNRNGLAKLMMPYRSSEEACDLLLSRVEHMKKSRQRNRNRQSRQSSDKKSSPSSAEATTTAAAATAVVLKMNSNKEVADYQKSRKVS